MTAGRLDALVLVQAMQVAHSVAALQAIGIMDALSQPALPDELSARFGVDARTLHVVLDHVSRATSLLRRRPEGRFQCTTQWNPAARFLVALYGGAFAPNAAQVRELLYGPAKGAALVDRAAHAEALAACAIEDGTHLLAGLLFQLGMRRILDMGCGTGALLTLMACSDRAFEGWGVDFNALGCKLARSAARQAGVARRVHVVRADARNIEGLPPNVRGVDIQALVASQFLNELFGSGTDAAVKWIRDLRANWPGRLLFVSDYYGRLGTTFSTGEALSLIHDHAQCLSGQGVPPPTRKHWACVYIEAGARLVHAVEFRGSTRFVHVVAL